MPVAGLLVAVTLLLPGCRSKDDGPPQLEQRLLADVFSEQRFEANWSLVDRVVLDFRDSLTLRNLYLPDLDFAITPRGLVGTSRTGDPRITLPYAEPPWTELEVALQSEAETYLEVYWAGANEGFSEARKKRIDVHSSREPVRYLVDLRSELAGAAGGVRLRVDPVAGKAEFTLRRIELARPSAAASGDRGQPLTGVKVRLGGDTREALVLSSGRPVEWPLSVPPRAYLAFGAAVQHAPRRGCVLRLGFRDRDQGETVLFEQPLAADERGWKSWKVPLDRLAGRRGSLRAEVIPQGQGGSAAIFWSNPAVGRSARRQRRPNVILVSVDTLGSRHLSAYGAERSGDEFFTQMARRGVLFENAFSNSSLTNISHGTMLTGRWPLGTAPFWVEESNRREPSIAEILRRDGAFDMKGGGFSKDDAGWSGTVELGEHPYLIVVSGRNPDERGDVLDLGLSEPTGAPLARYEVKLAELGERPSVVRATGTARTLQSWRVRPPVAGETIHGTLAAEEAERLRALGYLQ